LTPVKLSPEQQEKVNEILNDEEISIYDLDARDLFERVTKIIGDHPILVPVVVAVVDAIVIYFAWKANEATEGDLNQQAIINSVATEIMGYNTLILGAWVIWQTESELGELTGLAIMGIPIFGEAIEKVNAIVQQTKLRRLKLALKIAGNWHINVITAFGQSMPGGQLAFQVYRSAAIAMLNGMVDTYITPEGFNELAQWIDQNWPSW